MRCDILHYSIHSYDNCVVSPTHLKQYFDRKLNVTDEVDLFDEVIRAVSRSHYKGS